MERTKISFTPSRPKLKPKLLLIAACSTPFLEKTLKFLFVDTQLSEVVLLVTNRFQADELRELPFNIKIIFTSYLQISYRTFSLLKNLKPDCIVLILERNTKNFYSRLELLAFLIPAKLKWYIENDLIVKFPNAEFYKRLIKTLTKLTARSLFSALNFLLIGTTLFVKGVFVLILHKGQKSYIRRLKRKAAVLWTKYNLSWLNLKGIDNLGSFLVLELLVWVEFITHVFLRIRLKEPQRILFIRLDHIGDLVNSIPALKLLKKIWPTAFLTIVIGKWGKEIVKNCPYIDEILVYPTNNKWHLRGEKDKCVILRQFLLFFKLRLRKYDLAIDPCGWPETYKILYMSGAKVKIAHDYGRWDFHHNVILRRVPDNDGIGLPERKRVINLLKQIGIKSNDDPLPELWLDNEEKQRAEFFLETHGLKGRKVIGLHPGAPWPPRRWMIDRFAEIADRIAQKYKWTILIFAGPGEEELIEQFSKHVKIAEYVPVVGKNLREFMAIVSKCHLFICNDSGPMHIAVALRIPTVAIFGPGGVARWAPPSPPHVVIRNPNISCSPCPQISCHDNICLKSISVDQVWEGVEKLIKQNELVDRENPPS